MCLPPSSHMCVFACDCLYRQFQPDTHTHTHNLFSSGSCLSFIYPSTCVSPSQVGQDGTHPHTHSTQVLYLYYLMYYYICIKFSSLNTNEMFVILMYQTHKCHCTYLLNMSDFLVHSHSVTQSGSGKSIKFPFYSYLKAWFSMNDLMKRSSYCTFYPFAVILNVMGNHETNSCYHLHYSTYKQSFPH